MPKYFILFLVFAVLTACTGDDTTVPTVREDRGTISLKYNGIDLSFKTIVFEMIEGELKEIRGYIHFPGQSLMDQYEIRLRLDKADDGYHIWRIDFRERIEFQPNHFYAIKHFAQSTENYLTPTFEHSTTTEPGKIKGNFKGTFESEEVLFSTIEITDGSFDINRGSIQ